MRSYTVEQIRAAEQVALQRFGDRLMLRAATALALTAVRELGAPVRGRRVVLLVGGGNNGGDALFAGANLARRGVHVDAVLVDESRTHPAGLAAFRRAGGRTATPDDAPVLLGRAELIVDGLVGIGVRPPLRPAVARLVELANGAGSHHAGPSRIRSDSARSANRDRPDAGGGGERSRVRRLAVDVPSGVDPDTGRTAGPAFRADLTVTFGGVKTGLLISPLTGRLEVQLLDFPLTGGPFDALALDDEAADELLPQAGADASKYSQGVVGIAAGSVEYPGAAVLCTGGAIRTRPGMVRFAGAGLHSVLARWPEVVATEDVATAGRVQAWVVGPGLGTDDRSRRTLHDVLAAEVPVLVDADGLRLLAADPELLTRRHHLTTVLTPHAGEFAALFPDLDPTDRLASTRAAAARSGAIVLLKGHRTVIADPAGRTAINLNGSPWLASAGSGDVLSGITGSLLASGMEPFLAVALGAHLHGRAGERAERAGIAGAQALWDHLR